jgi:hypothetical protein
MRRITETALDDATGAVSKATKGRLRLGAIALPYVNLARPGDFPRKTDQIIGC